MTLKSLDAAALAYIELSLLNKHNSAQQLYLHLKGQTSFLMVS
ncbi:hypothetical protein PEDI_17440 [Persicobacter diffluens]|uniref:Uncharacterized protein n=1 Tax=Persicobacter diffluens TaxID=981 RepID=A0AAN4VXD0_9BACT|nr:hypothetical protein PEDI_17440 [Persicobacter diffluens]